MICGHENVGVVVATGGSVRAEDGRALEVGDRIVPGANVTCGDCHFCRNGFRYYLCERLEDYGNSLSCASPPHLFGGWAEYLYLLPGSRIFRVPDVVPDNVAVLTEPMAVTHGIDAAARMLQTGGGPGPPFDVVVIGLGPLGLCHLIKSVVVGAAEVIAVDRLRGRLEATRPFGTTLALDASETTPAQRREAVVERTHGVGADIVVDCSGVASTFTEALHLVRPGGVIVEAGAFVDVGTVPLDPAADICARDVTVIGVGGERAEDYTASLDLMSVSQLPFERVVTHRFGLDDASQALEVAQSGEAMKVVFEPALRSGRHTP